MPSGRPRAPDPNTAARRRLGCAASPPPHVCVSTRIRTKSGVLRVCMDCVPRVIAGVLWLCSGCATNRARGLHSGTGARAR
eukprot:1776700-Prymnesium_polylepis.1